MAAFLRELRYSLRTLGRNPAFTLAAVVTIGLGIGCSTAIFSAFNATVLRNGEMLVFQRQVLEQVRAIPGVMSASLGSNLPLSSGIYTMFMFQKPDRGWTVSPVMEENKVGANYFATLRIPVLRVRAFNHLDSASTPCVAILNQTAAGDIWPGENPVGKVINLSAMAPFAGSVGAGNEKPRYCEIVGEVAGARFLKLVEMPGPEIYFPRLQEPAAQPVLMVRTAGTPLALANAIIGRADSIDKNQRIMWAFSMDQLINRSALQPRFRAILLSLFAGLTLLIAAFGIYCVMVYFVSRRTREIGIRMASGAQRIDVIRMVVGKALLLSIIGVAVGTALSLALGRLVSGFLYKVKPADPLTFAALKALILAVAAIASYLPARRATKIDPVETLRYE